MFLGEPASADEKRRHRHDQVDDGAFIRWRWASSETIELQSTIRKARSVRRCSSRDDQAPPATADDRSLSMSAGSAGDAARQKGISDRVSAVLELIHLMPCGGEKRQVHIDPGGLELVMERRDERGEGPVVQLAH